MIYYLFSVDNGYCGCTDTILVSASHPWTKEELDNELDHFSYENAYGMIDSCIGPDYTDEEEEDYYADASAYGKWEQISEEQAQELIKEGQEVINYEVF